MTRNATHTCTFSDSLKTQADLPNPPPQLTSQRKPPAMINISILNLPQIEEEKCQVQMPEMEHNYSASTATKICQHDTADINSKVLTDKIVQLHTELISAHQKPEYNLSAGQIVQAAVDIGFRWTVNEKAMALGIYFRSRKAYQTLCALFTMPSASTLNRYVRGIPSIPGVSSRI
ncbi:hypothetical protein LOTGIDRAFT_159976 [Lottia gigantea]|uniref:Uncharacterized protein n=1 Tax=Lottia gigantea TaxID=225164 RepID=V4AI17_LOTGI|nr:hypothetical protein LOTGIDRAFT_159976 [Lottia gigantea]ESO96557.1 hypothetical protein LOTGIDRAFT_159976 [Lottia gigantea]